MNIIKKISAGYKSFGQFVHASLVAPTKSQGQTALFMLGVTILVVGLSSGVIAQDGSLSTDELGSYNDERIAEAVNRIFQYLEGAFGALVMVAAGLGAILAAAFGQYRAALGLLVVAVGAFILRSLVATFFNDESIA